MLSTAIVPAVSSCTIRADPRVLRFILPLIIRTERNLRRQQGHADHIDIRLALRFEDLHVDLVAELTDGARIAGDLHQVGCGGHAEAIENRPTMDGVQPRQVAKGFRVILAGQQFSGLSEREVQPLGDLAW